MLSRTLLVVAIAGALLAGCSSFSSKGPDYRSQGGKIPSLEVPPDLTSPIADDRFVESFRIIFSDKVYKILEFRIV